MYKSHRNNLRSDPEKKFRNDSLASPFFQYFQIEYQNHLKSEQEKTARIQNWPVLQNLHFLSNYDET